MADSTHPLDKPTGGKGDRDIRTDPARYRDALFWKRSACCNARVGVRGDDGYYCKQCHKPTKTK